MLVSGLCAVSGSLSFAWAGRSTRLWSTGALYAVGASLYLVSVGVAPSLLFVIGSTGVYGAFVLEETREPVSRVALLAVVGGSLLLAGWYAPTGGLTSSDVARDADLWLSPWLGGWAAMNAAGHCCLHPWLSVWTFAASFVFATTRLCLWALAESDAWRAVGYLCATAGLCALFYVRLEWGWGFVLSCLVSSGLVFRELEGEPYEHIALFLLGVSAVPCAVACWPRRAAPAVLSVYEIEAEPCIQL